MAGLKKHKIKKLLFGIIGLIFIPVISYLLSLNGPKGDLILVTFSQIGSRYGAIENLIIWGIISSFYYFSIMEYLIFLSDTIVPGLKLFLSLSCLSLLITVFLPFAPSMFPIASETHNILAYITGVSIVTTLFIYIFSFWNRERGYFYKSFFLLIALVIILIIFLIAFGVSSLFQIILSCALCSYMYMELIFLEKSKIIDISLKFDTKKKSEEAEELF